MTQNRRQFSRIQFHTDGQLRLPDGLHAVEVLDLSLKGALVRPRHACFIQQGTQGDLQVPLDHLEAFIHMAITVVHHQNGTYGLACREIDLDSVTHLRRLVQLNLGDEALADREFALLASA